MTLGRPANIFWYQRGSGRICLACVSPGGRHCAAGGGGRPRRLCNPSARARPALAASNWYPAAASTFRGFGRRAVRLRFNYLPGGRHGKAPLLLDVQEEAAEVARGPPGCGPRATAPAMPSWGMCPGVFLHAHEPDTFLKIIKVSPEKTGPRG